MHPDIQKYISDLPENDQPIGAVLSREIDTNLPDAESKIWHAHPVWFINGNPIVGFSKLKDAVRLGAADHLMKVN